MAAPCPPTRSHLALGGWLGELCRARLLSQIPPLGKHYSQRWAQEDLLEEQKDGARAAAAADKKKGVLGPLTELDTKGTSVPPAPSAAEPRPLTPCPQGGGCPAPLFTPARLRLSLPHSRFVPDVDALLKKSEAQHEQPEDGCPFGPLTQRLLQALVEVRGLRGAVPWPSSVGQRCQGPAR